MSSVRKVILYIASSLDGFILGRKTYDWVLTQVSEFPHADKTSYIVTRTSRPTIGKTIFYTGDLKDLVLQLKSASGKNIFVDGGSEIVNELLSQNLIDEMIISVIPILVGNGTRLFKEGRPEQSLKLISSKQFDTGLLQLHYKYSDN